MAQARSLPSRGSRLSGQGRKGVNKGFYKGIRAAFQDMRERLGEGERETERERETQTLEVKGELRDEKAVRPTGADGDSPPRATVAPPRAAAGLSLGLELRDSPSLSGLWLHPARPRLKFPSSHGAQISQVLDSSSAPTLCLEGPVPLCNASPQQPLWPAQQRSTRP